MDAVFELLTKYVMAISSTFSLIAGGIIIWIISHTIDKATQDSTALHEILPVMKSDIDTIKQQHTKDSGAIKDLSEKMDTGFVDIKKEAKEDINRICKEHREDRENLYKQIGLVNDKVVDVDKRMFAIESGKSIKSNGKKLNCTTLLVENDDIVGEYLSEGLKRIGCKVSLVRSYGKAVKLINKIEFDNALIDYRLERNEVKQKTGLTLWRYCKDNNKICNGNGVPNIVLCSTAEKMEDVNGDASKAELTMLQYIDKNDDKKFQKIKSYFSE